MRNDEGGTGNTAAQRAEHSPVPQAPAKPSAAPESVAGLRARQAARLRAQARLIGAGRRLATCADPPPAGLLRGIEQFNARDYFACHETLEELWNEEPGPVRVLYKGVLQVGVGCYHLLRGNYRGAVIKLQTGADYLEPFAPACMTLDVASLIAAARQLRTVVVELGAEHLGEVDRRLLPIVHLLAPPAE